MVLQHSANERKYAVIQILSSLRCINRAKIFASYAGSDAAASKVSG